MKLFQRPPGWRSDWRGVVVAVVWVVVASLVSKALSGVMSPTPIMPFYGAVVLSLWFGGVAGGLTATVLSILALGGLVSAAPGVWALTATDTPRIVTFIVLAILLSLISLGREVTVIGPKRLVRRIADLAYSLVMTYSAANSDDLVVHLEAGEPAADPG